jgi:hypothetical protein
MAEVRETQEQFFPPTAMDGGSAGNAGAVFSADRHGLRKCRRKPSVNEASFTGQTQEQYFRRV